MVERLFQDCSNAYPPLIENNPAPPPKARVDYSSKGENWDNLCETSKKQSPINIVTKNVESTEDSISFQHMKKIELYKNYTMFNVARYDNLDDFLLVNFT